MDPSPSLLVDQDGGLLTLTLNRPERGNAIDAPLAAALIDVFEGLAADPGEARAVLLRSEGKHFCTGADIGGAGERQRDAGKPTIGHMARSLGQGPHRVIEAVFDCPLPVVAELSGRTSGMGLHLALCCDVTVAAASATFAEPFAQRGFNVDSGGSWLLPRFVGLTRAKQLLYRGDPIDARTAEAWGLVSEVVTEDELQDRARLRAQQLAAGATFALSTMKSLLREGLTSDLAASLLREAAAIELTIRSDDFKEGMRAFAEKRPPGFTGR
ncbi:MAG: enoyl-CoA hydratase-related protein [Acidimicrobiales bacterium]